MKAVSCCVMFIIAHVYLTCATHGKSLNLNDILKKLYERAENTNGSHTVEFEKIGDRNNSKVIYFKSHNKPNIVHVSGKNGSTTEYVSKEVLSDYNDEYSDNFTEKSGSLEDFNEVSEELIMEVEDVIDDTHNDDIDDRMGDPTFKQEEHVFTDSNPDLSTPQDETTNKRDYPDIKSDANRSYIINLIKDVLKLTDTPNYERVDSIKPVEIQRSASDDYSTRRLLTPPIYADNYNERIKEYYNSIDNQALLSNPIYHLDLNTHKMLIQELRNRANNNWRYVQNSKLPKNYDFPWAPWYSFPLQPTNVNPVSNVMKPIQSPGYIWPYPYSSWKTVKPCCTTPHPLYGRK